MNGRSNATSCLRGIRLAIRYGNASLSRLKLRNARMTILLLIVTIGNSSNTSYGQSRVKVRVLGSHRAILMFHLNNV
jgi:hypothetical protein